MANQTAPFQSQSSKTSVEEIKASKSEVKVPDIKNTEDHGKEALPSLLNPLENIPPVATTVPDLGKPVYGFYARYCSPVRTQGRDLYFNREWQPEMDQLVAMGFTENDSKLGLALSGGNIQVAVSYITTVSLNLSV